ncbi:MAG: tetratricopeptide repeat protein [Gemmatimonadota bacterium]
MRAAAVLIVLALLAGPWQDAARLAEQGDLESAERAYRVLLADDGTDPTLHYNLGTVLLRQGRFDEAREHLARAATSVDQSLGGAAAYNLGNTDLEPVAADPGAPGRAERLRRAIEAYKAALREDPEDDDARWNLELARRLLERDERADGGGAGGGGGGGGGEPTESGQVEPLPSTGGGGGVQPELSPTPAEALLSEARERELRLQRDRLRRPQPAGPIRP